MFVMLMPEIIKTLRATQDLLKDMENIGRGEVIVEFNVLQAPAVLDAFEKIDAAWFIRYDAALSKFNKSME